MSNGLLKKGSTGPEVRVLQRALAAAGFDPGPADGIFGVRTERAVKAFQAQRGFAIDGVAGPQTRGALRSLPIPLISVRQPRPWDLVADPILVAGLMTGFEATIQVRVRDANGNAFVEKSMTIGRGDGISEVQFDVATGVPPSTQGGVELFEFSAADGSEINKTTVPVVFGRAIVDPYGIFQPYVIQQGDTLRSLAQEFYGDPNLSGRLFDANPHQLSDPNTIVVGQVLRIPLS